METVFAGTWGGITTDIHRARFRKFVQLSFIVPIFCLYIIVRALFSIEGSIPPHLIANVAWDLLDCGGLMRFSLSRSVSKLEAVHAWEGGVVVDEIYDYRLTCKIVSGLQLR